MDAVPCWRPTPSERPFPRRTAAELLVLDGIELSVAEGEIVGTFGTVRIGQVDTAAHHFGAVAPSSGAISYLGEAGRRPGGGHRDGVSELRALSLVDGSRKRADRA